MTKFQEFKKFVEELNKENGRLYKEAVLEKYKDDYVIKEILNFIYNPYRLSGISKKKFNKPVPRLTSIENSILNIIEYLDKNNSGRTEDIQKVQSFEEYGDPIYEAIITKNLQCGATATTLNKIFGEGFIPTFNVQLAFKLSDNPEKLLPLGTEFALTQKFDGGRCLAIPTSGGYQFFSRNGQVFEQMDELAEAFKWVIDVFGEIVFDGELLVDNVDNLDSKDLYRATMKVIGSDKDKSNVIFNVFDALPKIDFEKGFCATPYIKRYKIIERIIKQINYRGFNNVKLVKHLYVGSDQTQIEYYGDKLTAEGKEGAMLNKLNSPYECKRSTNLLKIKKFQSCDLRVVDLEEGRNDFTGKLGACIVEFPAPDGKRYRVKVGSGIKKEEREFFWQNKNEILGKIIEVSYFEVSQNQDGGYSLRFPVFKSIRLDKDEESMN